jgi:putative transcriptional regulator
MDEFFNIAKLNLFKPEKGKVLLSEPFLEDNFFKRSVVYLCSHNKDGSFGFIINNVLTVCLHELVDGIESCDFSICFGGPVNSSNLYFIHSMGHKIPNSYEISEGIFTGGDFELIKEGINNGTITNRDIRFFLGYSGWSEGQLDEELKLNSWIVGEMNTEEVITTDRKSLWKEILDKMGGKYKVISNFPEDPNLN